MNGLFDLDDDIGTPVQRFRSGNQLGSGDLILEVGGENARSCAAFHENVETKFGVLSDGFRNSRHPTFARHNLLRDCQVHCGCLLFTVP